MKTTRPRVIMLIPNLDFGGAQRSFAQLSVALAQVADVIPVVFNRNGLNTNYVFGGALKSLDVFPGHSMWSKMVALLQRIRRFGALRKQINPVCTISFLEGADYVNLLASKRGKIVLSIRGSKRHDQNITGLIGWFRLHIMMPLLYRRCDEMITVAAGIEDEMRTIVPRHKIRTIHNWYDFETIREKSNEQLPTLIGRSSNEEYIVAVGRLSPEKGFHHLITVFAEVVKTRSVRLVLVGDGHQGAELVNLCKQCQLRYDAEALGYDRMEDAQVIFLGYSPNPYPVIRHATLLALTSSAEGFPNVLVEAMSLSVPVISTDCPHGPREILNPGNEGRHADEYRVVQHGVLAPLFDHPSGYAVWHTALKRLLQDDALRDQLAARAQEYAATYSEAHILPKWFSVIGVAS